MTKYLTFAEAASWPVRAFLSQLHGADEVCRWRGRFRQEPLCSFCEARFRALNLPTKCQFAVNERIVFRNLSVNLEFASGQRIRCNPGTQDKLPASKLVRKFFEARHVASRTF